MRLLTVIFISTWSILAHASPEQDLQAIFDAHWNWYLENHPRIATRRGERSGNDRWPDMSPAALEQRYQQRGQFLRQLAAIDPEQLSAPSRLNQRLLAHTLASKRQHYELGVDFMDLKMRNGPHNEFRILGSTAFANSGDYQLWLARMEALPAYLEQYRALLDEGIRRQRVQARTVVTRISKQIDSVLATAPEQHPFYQPFVDLAEGVPAGEAEQLRARARALVDDAINPAYRRFQRYLTETYLPASRDQAGVGALPGGKAIYEFLARDFTTTDNTPEQIHAIGKREVARILAEMEQVKAETGFEGDLQAFNEFLRSDPQFYYDSPEALYEAYLAMSKRLDPELVKLFGKLPRMPYGVRPIPAAMAPDTTTAYYQRPAANGSRAGFYYVNLYRPEVRPKYEMEALSVHEAVPGHHLQLALEMEIENMPAFRSTSSVTAFVEGWGLYSESLGYQMGLYQDPYSRYGQLTYDMWRAVRLVVDTGIHYLGWSRQQAIDYFTANAGKSEADIINEIDRYIEWPGQALAYKIGQLKILELRAGAEQALGEAFDIRDFHDTLLGAGSIPLDALEERMDDWLATQLAGAGS
ncbi:DUF885 family protein [Seongchinamella sediminis]|uniref:DUF885 family protein n=1 Tax=Seongchinamella sediminis TaxID=2283635 RepID=A0A3L7DWC7_9GAMM|nr:DUF885 domain-containing protein [Seongchinamella sediminis]RLQ21888.1 DUF885 family protein [Seongchinamella sediminis]